MKLSLAIAASFAALCASADAATTFRATLTGDQEVPPTMTGLVAEATLSLVDTDGDMSLDALDMVVRIPSAFNFGGSGVLDDNGGSETVTVFHIHNAERGSNGGVVFGIIGPDSDTDGDRMFFTNPDGSITHTNQWDLNEGTGPTLDDFIGLMMAAAPGDDLPLYFNLHTASAPGGLIRGQIVATPVPAALPLFGTVLAGFGLWRRRRA